MKKVLLGLVIVFACVAQSTFGAPPQLINYQGMLTDSAGDALDGTYNLTLNLYTEATGGAAVWTETHNSVTVTDGLFNVLLGSVNANTLAAIFQANDTLHMEIRVGSETLSPRMQIGSAGYALKATNGAIAYGSIKDDGTINSATPNVSCSFIGASTWYEITISGENFDYQDYVTVVTPISTVAEYDRVATTYSFGIPDRLVVFIWDASAASRVPSDFSFVIYKP